MRIIVIAGPNGAGKGEVADEWQSMNNSVRPPLLLQESGGWQGVRESRLAGRSLARGDPDAPTEHCRPKSALPTDLEITYDSTNRQLPPKYQG